MGAQMQRGAYSRVCGASTAKRPAAMGYAGAGPAQDFPLTRTLSLQGRVEFKAQNRFNCRAFCLRLFGSFLGLPFFFGSRRTGSSSSASCFRANGLAPDTCNRVSNSPDVSTVLPWALAKLPISWSDETTAQSEPYLSASRLITVSAVSPWRE